MTRLLRSQSDIPEWFPLATYSEALDGEGWLNELAMRFAVQTVYRNFGDAGDTKGKFTTLIIERQRAGSILRVTEPKSLRDVWGIKPLTAFELAYLSEALADSEEGLNLIEKVCELRETRNIYELLFDEDALGKARDSEFSDFIDWESEPFEIPDILPRVPITVDLDQDDETLKAVFEVFLAGARAAGGDARKPFSQKDYDEWAQYGVLQVFDLQFWASLSGQRYSDNALANAIWPHEDVDTTERVRKVSRPKVKFLLDDWSAIARLHRQLEVEMGLKQFIESEAKQENLNPE